MIAPRLPRISDYVGHWAGVHPDREAAIGPRSRLTYAELHAEVERCASALFGHGVRHGDRVALLGPPSPEFFVVFLATARLGAIWVGLNPRYTLEELSYVVGDSEPKILFALGEVDDGVLDALRTRAGATVVTFDRAVPGLSEEYRRFVDAGRSAAPDEVAAACDRVGPLDPAAMVYTSGSTGRSKGALVPHGGLAFCGTVQAEHWYGENTRKLCDLPINHIGCLGDICCAVLTAGGTLAFMPRFDAAGALALIERERLTHVLAIPTQLIAAVETPDWSERDLSSLERIVWGGAMAPMPLLTALARTGVQLSTSYSLTESTGSVTFTADDDPLDVLGWSIGTVDPRYDVRVAGANGAPVAPGEQGEIWIRGDFITRGYFRRPEATAQAIDADGWLHSGDLAVEETGGRIRLVGRRHDMFKSGGYNIYPREIELVLETHPAVALAAVVGVPDERWGEVGHAFLAVRDAVTVDELDRLCRAKLANYKVPKFFHLSDRLPMLPVGKVDKVQLRRLAGR